MPGAPNYFKALNAKTPVAKLAHNPRLLDLLAEDNRLNVYAGELEGRPPGAPTTGQLGAPCDKRRIGRARPERAQF